MPKEDPFVNRAQLLKAIKKYPEIWDSNNKLHMCRSVTAPMWNEIAEQFSGHVPTVKLQSIWSQMKYHYHNLVHRQILHKDRFTTKWEHFEPMSFMYNITVAKIVGANTADNNSQQQQQQQDQQQHSAGAQPHSQGRGRPSGSFTWLPSASSICAGNVSGSEVLLDPSAFTGFSGLVPPAAITVETTTTSAMATPVLRKPGRPGCMNNGMRAKIIDAIRARPMLWEGRQRERGHGQNRTSAIWKEVAAELGLSPSLVQTRWSIIKQRYVDELQKQRHSLYHSQLPFHSNWEHFERMAFMRDILLRKVDDREQTRERIQEIVSEKLGVGGVGVGAGIMASGAATVAPSVRYIRSGAANSTTTAVSGGLVGANELICAGANTDIACGVVHDMAAVDGRRRIKHESDLEWDPFEMILHVHGAEAGNNNN